MDEKKTGAVTENNGVAWIPCTERLPEERERVLIARRERTIPKESRTFIDIGQYFNGLWYVLSAVQGYYAVATEVTAWMELPEVYEGE